MVKMLLACSIAVLLYGCAQIETPLDDGYDLGDLGTMRDAYCIETNDKRRAVLLAVAFKTGAPLPPNGICTDPLELLQ